MKKKNNKKWALVLVLLLVVSIGYAALASNLKINGSSSVKSATWDVYWNNVQVTQGSVEATQGNQARITDQAKTQVEYSVTLNEPGDFYEFTVDAVNNGTIDAMIAANGIVDGVYTDAEYQHAATLPDAIKYSVTYADGTEIAPKHLLAKKNGNTPTTETYKVRIEYRNDNDVDPEDLEEVTNQTYYFKFSVNYVQADGSEIEVPHPVSAIRYVKRQNAGQITPGDVIGIGETEDFYVLSTDDSENGKTILFAKYNLLVGEYEDQNHEWHEFNSNDSGYGLQSVTAVGGYGKDFDTAVVPFSSSNYWVDENDTLLSPYNKDNTIYLDTSSSERRSWNFKYSSNNEVAYPYVYDSNSNIYQYINGENGYINRLKEMGAPNSITGRLLSREEADMYQTVTDNEVSVIFDDVQDYWLGSSNGSCDVVMTIYGDGGFNAYFYTLDHSFGVRPVIEIPTSALN